MFGPVTVKVQSFVKVCSLILEMDLLGVFAYDFIVRRTCFLGSSNSHTVCILFSHSIVS
jgi:hypothetical protein